MTPNEILARHNSRELSEWIAFDRISPFGDKRADVRTGVLGSTMVNIWKGRGGKPAEIEDFIPDFTKNRGRKKQTWEDQKKIVEMMNAAFGGKVVN